MSTGFSFEPQNEIPCQTCGFPLPRKTLYRVVRDDSDPGVIASVMDGTINGVVCPNDGYRGWAAIMVLWVERRRKRAVFVAPDSFRDDQVTEGLRELSDLALHDVSPTDRGTILARLQRVRFPSEIAGALEHPVEDAERDQIAYEAFRRRELLPLPERFERLIADVLESGALHCAGREVSPEFLALVEAALTKVDDQDDSRRAQALRLLFSNLARRVPRDATDRLEVPGVNRYREGEIDSAKLTESLLRFYRPASGDPVPGIPSNDSDAPPPDFAQLASAAAAAGNRSERIEALQALATAYFSAGLAGETLATARELIDLTAASEEDRQVHAPALILAGAAAARAGDAHAAMSYLARSEGEMRKLPGVNPFMVGFAAESIADAQMLLRNFPFAKAQYKRAGEWYERANVPHRVRRALEHQANASLDAGDAGEAIAIDRRILDEQGDQLSVQNVRTRINLGIALAAIGKPPKHTIGAIGTFMPGSDRETQTEERLDDPPPVASPGFRCRVEMSMNTEGGQEQILFESIVGDEAIDQLARARREAIAIGAHDLELSCYAAMANAYLKYEMRVAARDILQLSIKRHQELGRAVRPHTLATLASVWEAAAQDAAYKGNQDEARHAWTRALTLFEATVGICESGTPIHAAGEILAQSRGGQALCLEALGRHAEAREAYRKAMGMFEGVRRYLLERDQKEYLQRRSGLLFPRAQRNNLQLHEATGDAALLEEAFYFAEAGRSRILLDEIGAAGIARPVALEEIAGSLPAGTALVQYSLVPPYWNCPGSWATYTVLPQSGLAPFVLRHDLDQMLGARDAVYAAFKEFDIRSPEEHATFDAALEDLGRLLLPKRLVDFLRQHGTQCIIFAPESYLFDVPFAALRVPWNGNVDDLCRAGIQTTVVPSASTYIAASERRIETSEPSLLCISDPQENLGVSEWVDAHIRTAWPGPSKHLAKQDATRGNVLNALPRSRVVFYLGHGKYHEEDVARSGLVLHDELLSMRDVMASQLNLECDLFLALACFGARVDADWYSREILGFSAALLQSGARNVVSGLWPLKVGFAEIFGAALMRHTAGGTPMAEAVRRALNDARDTDKHCNHPYLWAGVRLIGTGS